MHEHFFCTFALSFFSLCVSALHGRPTYRRRHSTPIPTKAERVITDNYNKIPPSYRSRATAVEQESEGYTADLERVGEIVVSSKGFVFNVPGMSIQQSRIITYAGVIALCCVVAMNLSRSQAIRLLALWCLVLTGIGAPVLVYVADDGAAAVMKNKAAQIQQKQQDRLSQAQ